MVWGWILLVVLLMLYVFYRIYFRPYRQVMANFETLVKVLETRDLLLLRILPELKDKKMKEKISQLIEKRMECKRKGCDAFIESDVNLNRQLPRVYETIETSKNPVVREEFRRIMSLEKNLKAIRKEYSQAVDVYNDNLVRHKKMSIKYLRMRPLNTYQVKQTKN